MADEQTPNKVEDDTVITETSTETSVPDAPASEPQPSLVEHEIEATPESDTTDTTSPASTPPVTSESKSSAQMIGLALVVAGVIVVGALFATGVITLPGSSDNAATPLSGLSDDDPIAVVNGEEISKALYDQQYQQTEAMLSSMGGAEQLNDPAFKQELQDSLINDLVNAELLYQAAVGSGIAITDEDIQTEYTATETQVGGPEELANQLSVIGLDDASLRDLIRRQLTIEQHLDAELDYQNIEVSDEDVQAFYDEFVAAGAPEGSEVPTLDEVRPQIESQIAQDRSAELIDGYIATLRADADIEVLI